MRPTDGHILKTRHRKRNDRADQKRDADDELAGGVHLVMCAVHDGERQHQRQQDQAQRAEQWMAQTPLELTAKFDHGLKRTGSLRMVPTGNQDT